MSISNLATEVPRPPLTVEVQSGHIEVPSRLEIAGVMVVVGPLPPPKHDWIRVRTDPTAWHENYSGKSLVARVDLPAVSTGAGVIVPTLALALLSDAGMSEVVVIHREVVEIGTQLTVTLFEVVDHNAVQQGEPFHTVVGNAKAG